MSDSEHWQSRPEGGGRYALWARDHEGALAMRASAELD